VTSVGRSLLPPEESEAFRQQVLRENAARRPGRYRMWAKIDPQGEAAQSLISLMLKHGVNLDATLSAFEPPFGFSGNDEQWKAVHNMAAFTVRYHQAGGPVTIGSHGEVANALEGFAFHREVEMHVEAGMPASAALQAATRVGAEQLRLDDRGILAPGKLADVVVIDGNPLQNIADLTKIITVILDGKVVDRAALLSSRPRKTGETKDLLIND